MAAPTVTITLNRPTRVDGSPFTSSVFNADRATNLSLLLSGLLAKEGGVINGNQPILGKLKSLGTMNCTTLTAPGVVPTSGAVTNLSSSGATEAQELLAKGGQSTKILHFATASYSISNFGGSSQKGVFVEVIPFAMPWPPSGGIPALLPITAKYGVLIFPITANHTKLFTSAYLWASYPFPVGTPPVTQLNVFTEQLAPGETISGTFSYIIFKHTA